MALFGLILHITAAVLFSLHVVVSRQSRYWLPALILVPLLAAFVYLLAIFLPEVRFERQVRRLTALKHRPAPVPARHPQALLDYSEVPSLQNRLRLAAALLDDGAIVQALRHYEECLAGPFGDDPEVQRGVARARRMNGLVDTPEESPAKPQPTWRGPERRSVDRSKSVSRLLVQS